MNIDRKRFLTGCILVALSATPVLVNAESASDVGNSNLSAAARLNLQVVIPGFLLFRVGTAGANADTISFDMTNCVTGGSCTVGDGTAFSNGLGGDAAGGSGASVSLFSNAGQVTITETNNTAGSGLVSGTSNLSLDEITAVSDNGSLDTPKLSDVGGNTTTPAMNGATNVTTQSAVWTYSYDNTTVPDPGTYDVQITYTATAL